MQAAVKPASVYANKVDVIAIHSYNGEGLDLEELVKHGQGALAYWQQGEKTIACERFDKFMELLVGHSDKWKAAQE